MSNDEDDDDSICKRTRARCSLASCTLDDLEAFLHETDDDDDGITSGDDSEEEEEYRKFLDATVSHSGDGDDGDDDEDKDVDFEIQLEQSLETDDEETSLPRPVTRRKRRPNISNHSRLLRPLVPIFPITQPVTRFYAVGSPPINGFFSQAQIRELHCLVNDHLQLLIQVYSLCAFDHSKQQIGTQVQGLISEMLHKRQRPSHVIDSVSPVLDLAGRYLVDVSSAVQDYRKSQVESGFDSMFERVPLFESGHKDPNGVHKNIAKLAKVFLPLFRVSLFPQKPPGGKRSLFTSAEDELLSLGIMEYNSDWKAIKQRFLPCKSEHQIFVRKKNLGASRAFENPIKAVLRMKKNNEAYLHERPGLLYSATSVHSYENDRLESPCVFPLGMRPYRARIPPKKSVVRLASDLPPVSLPSSASVILPSVFAKNQCSTTSVIKDGMPGRESLSSTEKVISCEKNDSGLVMHPLLFRTPENGQITTTCNTGGGSCSSSLLSEIRPQLLSIFEDSCVHCLLRRSEYEMSRRENIDTGIGKNANLCQLEDTSGAVDKACIDEMGDQSNQGIVMEREELSDSDQEMMEEEHVEFECEEMTDSQGDDDSECECECEGNSR